jgi:hypothetical protein
MERGRSKGDRAERERVRDRQTEGERERLNRPELDNNQNNAINVDPN